MNLNRI